MIPEWHSSSLHSQQISTTTSTNPTMPHNSVPPETGLRRMTTQTKNADTHPGKVVVDALHTQRLKDVIQKEKKEKQARKDTVDQAKANAEAGVHATSLLEATDAHVAANEAKQIPHRHQQPGHGMFSIAPEWKVRTH
jgi:hypothetical protein